MSTEDKEKIKDALMWLQSGDKASIAKELSVCEGTVSQVVNLKTKNPNVRVLAKALEYAEKNRKLIMAKIDGQKLQLAS